MTAAPTSPERDLPPAATRFRRLLLAAGHPDTVVALPSSARTAVEAANALGTTADSIASSLVFGIQAANSQPTPLLIVTSGGHRVDTARVADQLGTPELQRVDAAFVRAVSGYAIGGVAPIGWKLAGTDIAYQPTTLIDDYLAAHGDLWAAAGHPHCVFRTNYSELLRLTGGRPSTVASSPQPD